MTPTPPPGSLAKVQRMDSVLGDLGHRIGLWLSHPHMLTVSSFRGHPAPGLALALILLALCGMVLSLPVGVWMYKRRHHLRSSIRGLFSLTVWRERRKWNRCFRDTKARKIRVEGHPVPKPLYGWPTRAGTTLVMRFDSGMTCEVAQNSSDEFAAVLRCRDVVFEPIYHNRGRGYCRIIRRDTLARTVAWPWAPSETTNFLGPIPVAVDMDGKVVYMDLRSKNVLVGGIPGSGKSWFLHLLIAAAMGDVRVQVYILDGKMGVELSVWEKSCAAFATDDEPTLAMNIIKRLEDEVNKAFAALRADGKRTVDWSKATTVKLLVIDEYTAFLSVPGFEKSLNELVRRGRAAGLIVILTTQRPSAQVIKTDLRELIPLRVAMLCTDTTSSTMILGSGYNEFDSSKFSGKLPGEMWLLHEGRQPVRCRGYSLTDRDLAHLAARAKALRSKNDATNDRARNDVAHSGAANGSDTPTRVRSPISPLSLVPSPSPSPSPAPSGPSQPLPAVSPGLRPTLTFIALHGPQVASGDIQSGLGISSSTQLNRCNRLSALGYVYGARRAAKPGRGAGGRDPMLWSITDLGTAALTAKPAKEAGAQ